MAPLATMADDPGNVKVVVRCRAFVRRGMSEASVVGNQVLTRNREGEGHTMPDSHGSRNTKDDAPRARR
jgi:hypothetical protein